MANDAKRSSQLNVTNSVSANDRLLVLSNPATAANLQTITVNNFVNSISFSKLVNGNSTLSFSNTGLLTFPNGGQLGANVEGDVNGYDFYAPASLDYIGITYGPFPATGQSSYLNFYKENNSGANISSHGMVLQLWKGSANNTLIPWVFGSNGSLTFPDTTLQYTAFNTNTSYTFSNVISHTANVSINATLSVNNEIAAGNGFYTNSTFANSPSYGDGVVIDYVTGNGRISVGTNDGVTIYTGGVANTAMAVVNTTGLSITGNNLTLGSSLIAANGFSYLPNGLKMNFGHFICNTTSQVTFSNAFSTAVISITVTPANNVYVGANTPYVFASNTTTANIYSASTTTASNVYYMAIGF